MRPRALASILTLVLVLAAPAAAGAAAIHVVEPGESLSSVAAADGLSVSQLAAANGLSPEAGLLAGSTLAIPAAETQPLFGAEEQQAPVADLVAPASPESEGSYLVQPGDTLSAIAARAGVSVESLAAENGLDAEAVLLAGTVVRLPGAQAATASQAVAPSEEEAVTAAPGDAAPYPTEETIAPSEVATIAAENGVPSSLAEAVAEQESGFNNAFTSSADARGVMQILPETWSWIGQDLAGTTLDPASAASNVRGGVLMLHWLLNETEGDPALAAAGYYQGLESVRREGELPQTEQYVDSVLAQQARFE
jgi:N-acetylmuramoyl-L-alanine amidase